MGVYIYINLKINYELIDSIPENTTSGVSFYLYNYGSDPFYWEQRILEINLIKQYDHINLYDNHGLDYLYDDSLTLEQDGDNLYLYKTSSGKPDDFRLFAIPQSKNYAKIACNKCDIEYISDDKCLLTLYLVPTKIKINIFNHADPSSIYANTPDSSITSISIINDLQDTLFSYTPTKVNGVFEDCVIELNMTSTGIPTVIDHDEDNVFLYRANKNKPESSVYRASTRASFLRYLSIERIKFIYISDNEVDMHIYFTYSHGRVVEYYAIYSYTMLVPDNIKYEPDEEEP